MNNLKLNHKQLRIFFVIFIIFILFYSPQIYKNSLNFLKMRPDHLAWITDSLYLPANILTSLNFLPAGNISLVNILYALFISYSVALIFGTKKTKFQKIIKYYLIIYLIAFIVGFIMTFKFSNYWVNIGYSSSLSSILIIYYSSLPFLLLIYLVNEIRLFARYKKGQPIVH